MGQLCDKALDLIDEADWDHIGKKLVEYADMKIRRKIWAGARPGRKPNTVAIADGRDAADFANQAIQEMLDPDAKRTWDPEKEPDILTYLKGAVSSMTSNAASHNTNKETVRQFAAAGAGGELVDRIAVVGDPKNLSPEDMELIKYQKERFEAFKVYVGDESDLMTLIEAYEVDKWTNKEIEELTGLPAATVAELKRKLNRRVKKFLQARKEGDES